MTLKQLLVTSTAALAITLAGAVAAESRAEKDEAAAKGDAVMTGAAAEQKEADKLQIEADKAGQAAAAAQAKAKADPTAANKHEAKMKTQEAVDAHSVAGAMEGKAAADQKAVEELNDLKAVDELKKK
jgi:hypothetical protein